MYSFASGLGVYILTSISSLSRVLVLPGRERRLNVRNNSFAQFRISTSLIERLPSDYLMISVIALSLMQAALLECLLMLMGLCAPKNWLHSLMTRAITL